MPWRISSPGDPHVAATLCSSERQIGPAGPRNGTDVLRRAFVAPDPHVAATLCSSERQIGLTGPRNGTDVLQRALQGGNGGRPDPNVPGFRARDMIPHESAV